MLTAPCFGCQGLFGTLDNQWRVRYFCLGVMCLKITPNNISRGTKLWYRKKGSWDVCFLTVLSVGEQRFTFKLPNGKIASCSYDYASGRLFKNRNSLSSFAPRIQLERTYDGWPGSAAYSTSFDQHEVDRLEQIADRMMFDDD